MLKEFIDRENDIFNILNSLKNEQIDFILVGGYAVSAFKHRFSVDVDLIVKEEQLKAILAVLKKNNFEEYKSRDLENIYQGKFKSFIKKTKLPVTVDLLINSISSRQTKACWGFALFKDNSEEKEVKGIEKSVIAKVPLKELLIAMKIHSGRLTDIRDVVAISEGSDFNKVVEFTRRGDLDKLRAGLIKFEEIIINKNFIDSFKGVFSLENFPLTNFEYSKEIIKKLKEEIRGN